MNIGWIQFSDDTAIDAQVSQVSLELLRHSIVSVVNHEDSSDEIPIKYDIQRVATGVQHPIVITFDEHVNRTCNLCLLSYFRFAMHLVIGKTAAVLLLFPSASAHT